MRYFILFVLLPVLFISCEEEKTIFVADHYGVNQSYLVKEKESDKWISFTEKIAGFEYEEGFEYILKVKVEKENNTLVYSLVSVEKKTQTRFFEKQKTMKELTSKKWKVTSIKGFNNKTEIVPIFSVSDGNIKGFSGCNSFEGTIEVDATGTFNPGQLMGTKMYCEASMNIEKAFNKALSYAAKYTIAKNKLTVLSKDDTILFTAIEKKPDSIFATWTVDHIEGFENTTGSEPFFTILTGRIKGSNTCNGFDGTFTTDSNNKFEVSAIKATKRYCADKDALGKAFHKALRTATKFKIRKGNLLLLNDRNDLMLTAKKKNNKVTKIVKTKPKTIIEYNTYSRQLAIRNKLVGKSLKYLDLRPKPIDEKKVVLSDEDYAFIQGEISKLSLKKLAELEPPSIKHKQDAAVAATLIVTRNDKTVRVATFDHGNPPTEIKALIAKIMELRN